MFPNAAVEGYQYVMYGFNGNTFTLTGIQISLTHILKLFNIVFASYPFSNNHGQIESLHTSVEQLSRTSQNLS